MAGSQIHRQGPLVATLEGVHPELRQRIEGVMKAAQGRFWVTTGKRSMAEQERLYSAWTAAVRKHGPRKAPQFAPLAAVPGTSMHGRTPAMAVDLACNASDNKLRANLAKEWGLHTPVKGEPWHMELAPNRGPMPVYKPVEIKKDEEDMPKPDDKMDAVKAPNGGVWVLQRDGGVFAYQGAPFHGSYPGLPEEDRQGQRDFIAIEANGMNNSDGYTLLASDGGYYSFPIQ